MFTLSFLSLAILRNYKKTQSCLDPSASRLGLVPGANAVAPGEKTYLPS